ncbi:MAG: FAD-dependent monooxygenase [Bacteroidales bacterium]|nr:FAD-dependent monooxygenase [Bacteroidales bacterium]
MKTQNFISNFVILGGGIAGLTTAIALKKAGIESTIIEAAPEFKPVGAGIVLAVNALKAYQHLGIYTKIRAAGNPVRHLAIYNDKGKLLSKIQPGVNGLDYENLAIHRASLHQVLLAQLDKTFIINNKKTSQIKTTSEGYKVLFEDGSFISSRYLIVAEGIHSVIRRQFFPQATLRYSGYTCWRGVADIPELNLTGASETWGKNGRFGLVPLGNGKVYWFAVKNSTHDNRKYQQFGTRELFEIFNEYHHPIGSVILATDEDLIIWNDICDLNPLIHYAFGDLVLIGDAAHATTPNMGQGACQAIEDAVVLANCLQENSIVREAFLSFEKKRLKRTHFIVNQSWKMGKMAQLDNKTLIGIRNIVLRLMPESLINSRLKHVCNVTFKKLID